MNDATRDFNVMGEAVLPSGTYGRINAMGDLVGQGDLVCAAVNCMGDAKVAGSFRTERTNAMGDLEFRGPADAGDLNVMGEIRCGAGLRARKLNSMGDVKVAGNLDAQRVSIFGTLDVGGDCNAERLNLHGAFRIGGLLSVDELHLFLWKDCRTSDFGGSRIEVRRRRGPLGLLAVWDALLERCGLEHESRQMRADCIEGDDILLEDTDAQVVRGLDVRIGRGCRIERVEYSGTFSRHRDAEVGEVIRI